MDYSKADGIMGMFSTWIIEVFTNFTLSQGHIGYCETTSVACSQLTRIL